MTWSLPRAPHCDFLFQEIKQALEVSGVQAAMVEKEIMKALIFLHPNVRLLLQQLTEWLPV